MKNKFVYEAKINKKETNLVMNMLSKLYDSPEAAILREYVDNAYNANANANATKPVEVHLPEKKAPYLSIKDHGNGLDYLGIVSVFANFGTQRWTHNGCLTTNALLCTRTPSTGQLEQQLSN